VAWFAKRCAVVSGRAARTTYGIEIHHPYDEANPAHRRRSHLTWLDSHGERRLGGIFSPLIVKVRPSQHLYFRDSIPRLACLLHLCRMILSARMRA